MKKILLLFISALMAIVSVNAEKTYVWTDATEGNLVSSSDAFTATYTAKTTDVLNISSPEVFASVECNGETYGYKVVYGTNNGAYKYTFNVEAGQTVTFKSNMWMNLGTRVYITEGVQKLTMINLSPGSQSQAFPWNTQGMVTVNFNMFVTATKAYIQCPSLQNKQFNVDDARLGGSSALSCNITNALNEAYEAGLKQGMPVLVKFEGIKDEDGAKYAGTGVLTITYSAPQQQGRLVSATTNDGKTALDGIYTFKSYFDTEEKDGLFVFEFSTNIKQIGDAGLGLGGAVLSMGNLDQITEGRYYSQALPYEIKDNKIIVDARGVLRSLARMFPSVDFSEMSGETDERFVIDNTHIHFVLNNVKDTNGNFIYSPAQGSTGTFSYTFNYTEIVDNIAMDGDRSEDQKGSVKEEGSRIQLWIDQELKKIDGVKVYVKVDNHQGVDENEQPIYGTAEIIINPENIETLSSDPVEGTVIGFSLPSSLKVTMTDESANEGQTMECEPVKGTNIRIVLQVTTTNGMPHDLVIDYIYKEKTTDGIESITPDTNHNGNGVVYNMLGQQVDANSKGIVITNGKKVVR